MPRQTYTVPEVAAIFGIGRNAAYEGVGSGEIPSIRVGRRILVPRVAISRMLMEPDPRTQSDDENRSSSCGMDAAIAHGRQPARPSVVQTTVVPMPRRAAVRFVKVGDPGSED